MLYCVSHARGQNASDVMGVTLLFLFVLFLQERLGAGRGGVAETRQSVSRKNPVYIRLMFISEKFMTEIAYI